MKILTHTRIRDKLIPGLHRTTGTNLNPEIYPEAITADADNIRYIVTRT